MSGQNPNETEVNDLNNITNRLILKSDQKFNQLYNNILSLNSSIMNKEELIVKTNNEISIKEKTIKKLAIGVLFVIIYAVLVILYANKTITLNNLVLYSVLTFIAYVVVIRFYLYDAAEKLRDTRIAMRNYVLDQIVEEGYGLQCPTSCPQTSTTVDVGSVGGRRTPTLRTNSQLNVWEDGDLPVNTFTSKKNPAIKYYSTPKGIPKYRDTIYEETNNEPKPMFGTTYPKTTFYKCNWLGGDKTRLMPERELKTYSSIPCSYRPNFEETGRYICMKDPNRLSESDFKKYCDKI